MAGPALDPAASRPSVKLFGAVALYDLDDSEPYLQDTTGSVTVVSGGITWMF